MNEPNDIDERGAIARLESILDGLADNVVTLPKLRSLSDDELLHSNALYARATRLLESAGAAIAGELAFRSRPELGSSGLARRTGHRTVDNLLKLTTGATKEQVSTVVAAGNLLVEAADDGVVDAATGEVFTPTQPWLRPIATAIGAGLLSPAAAKAIGSGLGVPNSSVTVDQLRCAADELVAQAEAGVDADRLFRNARDIRADLDLAGVKLREEELRATRGLKHFPTATGGRAILDFDPENYAIFTATIDRMVSPKLGGVRFADPVRAEQADRIRDDDRTPAQLALDGFMHLINAGTTVDDSMLLGTGQSVVRITVTESALQTGIGLARLDGQLQPLSIETAKRLLCDGLQVAVTVDAFGRIIEPTEAEQRLFSSRQREVLAAKFGGCMDPDCDRPPSYCEAHHILQWVRDGGKTVTDNGILLCKYHHLKYHNEGYEIVRDDDGRYWKIPPTIADPEQTPIFMPLKTRNLHDLATATLRTQTLPAETLPADALTAETLRAETLPAETLPAETLSDQTSNSQATGSPAAAV